MARARRKASKEDTRNSVPYPKTRKSNRPRKPREEKQKHVCPTCGQPAHYIEVVNKEATNDQVNEIRGMPEMARISLMMGRVQEDLRKSKHKGFDLHETDTKEWAICPAKENAKWSTALMRKLAKTIAPFALVSKEVWRIHPKMIPHPPKKKGTRGGSL